ncbi:hypothetical protein GJAV_G00143030 [Gymnothorax javanicus]|nr:hypothetical protein GJAV_G00143030 [Gymnothorax javanicus]
MLVKSTLMECLWRVSSLYETKGASVGVHRLDLKESQTDCNLEVKKLEEETRHTLCFKELEFSTAVSSQSPILMMERLLCLDGGGIRGLVLIEMLMALEREAGRPVKELFDWISGTSTGGILALGIVHGKSLKEMRSLYFRLKDEIFQGSIPDDSSALEKFLKQEFGADKKMTELKHPRVMVTSVLADRRPVELHLFRNYDPPALTRGPLFARNDELTELYSPNRQLVWRAAQATSAAPAYFKPLGPFQDGGLMANNPTLVSMTEIQHYNKDLIAKGRESEVKRLGVVVSMGTGKPPQVEGDPADIFKSYKPWKIPEMVKEAEELVSILLDCCTRTESCCVDTARAWCEQTNTSYYRLTPQLNEEVKLNETDEKVLEDMLQETQKYLNQEKKNIQALAKQLLD